jgi:hypothetical protein
MACRVLSVLLILVEIFTEFEYKADSVTSTRDFGSLEGSSLYQLLNHNTHPHLVNIT